MASPGVTLTASLQDTSGNANPLSKLRITLCNFYQNPPRIVGTSLLAQIRQDISLAQGQTTLSIPLWGNYQINPTGTFYEIAVIDSKNNVVQAAMYVFSNAGTYDLSTLGPVFPAPDPYIPPTGIAVLTNPPGQELQTIDGPLTVEGNLIVTGSVNGAATLYVVPINSGAPVFRGDLGQGQSLTLTQNVTSATASGFYAGVLIPVLIKQDTTGGRTMVWPASWKGMPAINPAPNVAGVGGNTSFAVMLDESGAFFPVGTAVYS